MFTLIIALLVNPATGQHAWIDSEKGFTTYEQCETYAASKDGQMYLQSQGALSYNCDTLKTEK